MKFTFTLPKASIDKAYEHVVSHAVADTTLKGFRKGQAPKELVIKTIGEQKLKEKAIEEALPEAYSQAIKDKNLKPIAYPNIKLLKGEDGADLEFEAEIAQAPEVKLGDYQDLIKTELAKGKIWTPEKGGAETESTETTRDQKLNQIFTALLEKIKVEVPELLVEREVNNRLSKLLDQVSSIGLTIDAYLSSRQLTTDKLREQYTNEAKQSLSLEFILNAITDELKITVTSEELQQALKESLGDKKPKNGISPDQLMQLQLILARQKLFDHLLAL